VGLLELKQDLVFELQQARGESLLQAGLKVGFLRDSVLFTLEHEDSHAGIPRQSVIEL